MENNEQDGRKKNKKKKHATRRTILFNKQSKNNNKYNEIKKTLPTIKEDHRKNILYNRRYTDGRTAGEGTNSTGDEGSSDSGSGSDGGGGGGDHGGNDDNDNNNSNKNKSKTKTTTTAIRKTGTSKQNTSCCQQQSSTILRRPRSYYKPSVFGFHCYGFYSVTSNKKSTNRGSRYTTPLNAEEGEEGGTCYGIRGRLQWYADLETSTRMGALEQFRTHCSNNVDLLPTSVPLKYDISSITDKNESNNKNNNNNNTDDNAILDIDKLPCEKDTEKQSTQIWWWCFGRTKVRYLLLKDIRTNREHVPAVILSNWFWSVRDIICKFYNTEVRLWSITMMGRTRTLGGRPIKNNNSDGGGSDNSISGKHGHLSIQYAKHWYNYTTHFSIRFVNNLKELSAWLYYQVQDDFPRRMYESGKKTIQHMPKTCDSTIQFIRKYVLNSGGGGGRRSSRRDGDDKDDE